MAGDERATFSFGFFDGGPSTSAAEVVPPVGAGKADASAAAAPAAEARLLLPDDDNDDGDAPSPPAAAVGTLLSPIQVVPGVRLLKGTVAGEAAAAALLQGGGGGGEVAKGGDGAGGAPTPSAGATDAARRQLLADSDLVKGAYEGGFKLWEGALDLCAYLVESAALARLAARAAEAAEQEEEAATQGHPLSRRRPRVLELGCGHGLPGLLCLLAGADVDFQDYNAEVLEQLTRPNVRANLASAEALAGVRRAVGVAADGGGEGGRSAATLPPASSPGRARYIAGDWRGLPDLLRRLGEQEERKEQQQQQQQQQQGGGGGGGGGSGAPPAAAAAAPPALPHHQYDLVLTAETLYDAETGQAALLDALEAAVGPPPSAALVASKTHYFGVGGGTSAFRALVLERQGRGRGQRSRGSRGGPWPWWRRAAPCCRTARATAAKCCGSTDR